MPCFPFSIFLRIRRFLGFICLIFPNFSIFKNAITFFFSFLMFVLNTIFFSPYFFHFVGFQNSKRRIFFPIFFLFLHAKFLFFFFSFLMFVLNIIFPLFPHFFGLRNSKRWSLVFYFLYFLFSIFLPIFLFFKNLVDDICSYPCNFFWVWFTFFKLEY